MGEVIEKMISLEELEEGMLITADVYTRGGVISISEHKITTIV